MPEKLSDEQMNRLSEALEKGRKIDAIKAYRDATGIGLKDAKVAVEKLHADLHEQYPDRYPAPSTSVGCGSSAALFALACGLVYLISLSPA
ncbi:ribosomal protein L7/L12 [Pelagicoccus sp. SDUM812002]|uniref:ribosomal protein L7/L12 n=1 Tax=Pelagicoccus sp. SDUM812002 TaxID=3041266 RepID=UPI00280FE98C|nr:ribosomal protein L7/L12 [Pelagicoccus sp. SDUM812002]MDQ8186968.1 ribosomal protein L7/L12 [Pelagicoccus sp. SDUM812002]